MSMLDAFFNKGFKATKCKTLLKLTIPRIKLLRNRREIQIKQMRRDIAKLLEAGQEATARIRVEHIIREENMMAAQEIIELFCELISVRLPIIETQRECPLDLKEAISSVCFAAPRCADLPELLQVQMLFTAKYGKEFVSAATELMPDCGVNRQIIEFLSVRAPAPDVKLKLLKEIAEEHELDWDPAASEVEFSKPHEDLLNGPTLSVSESKLPVMEGKHDELPRHLPEQVSNGRSDSDSDIDPLDFPEVPKVLLKPNTGAGSAPEFSQPHVSSSVQPECFHESEKHSDAYEYQAPNLLAEPKEVAQERSYTSISAVESKQFVPFISPPSLSSTSFSDRQDNSSPSLLKTKSEVDVDLHEALAAAQAAAGSPAGSAAKGKSGLNVDLQDVLAAAQAAADSAERAAAAARSAASLAEIRINELINDKNGQEDECENPFGGDSYKQSAEGHNSHVNHQDSVSASNGVRFPKNSDSSQDEETKQASQSSYLPSYDGAPNTAYDSLHASSYHQPQRLKSMEDDPYFSYPNLFRSQDSNIESSAHSITDKSHDT